VRRARRRRADDSGVGAVTTALMMPALLMMIMLVVQAGLYWHAHQRASAAADRAAAAAATPTGSEQAGRQAAQLFLDGAPLQGASVQVERGAEEVEATVTGTAPRLVPGISFQVQATASAPVERFIPEDQRR
jgi:Flp pilus assembly protein TadG